MAMSSTASAARVRPHTVPNDLEPFWMPFTPNRQFKSDPRMLVGPMGAVFVRDSIYDAFMRGPGDRIELFHGLYLFRLPVPPGWRRGIPIRTRSCFPAAPRSRRI